MYGIGDRVPSRLIAPCSPILRQLNRCRHDRLPLYKDSLICLTDLATYVPAERVATDTIQVAELLTKKSCRTEIWYFRRRRYSAELTAQCRVIGERAFAFEHQSLRRNRMRAFSLGFHARFMSNRYVLFITFFEYEVRSKLCRKNQQMINASNGLSLDDFSLNERSRSVTAISQKEAFRAALVFDARGWSALFPTGIYSHFARKGI